MVTSKLTKRDWNKLYELGLTDGGVGNGFANTTDKFDDNILCNSFSHTYINVGKIIYMVKYVSGCFYPVWLKGYELNLTKETCYEIKKDGEIIRF